MRKFGILMTVFFTMLFGCVLPAHGADAVLYDEKGVLSEEEYEQCYARIRAVSEETGLNVGVLLGGDARSDSVIETLADTYYDECFGAHTDGLLYYMDLSAQSSPYDYISTSGMGQFYFTNGGMSNRIDDMFSDLKPYLYPIGSEDVVGALDKFSSLVVYYREMGVPSGYYVYDDVYECYFVAENGEVVRRSTRPANLTGGIIGGFWGFLFGTIIAVVFFLITINRYRFKTSLEPTAYANKKDLQIHHQYDNFVRTHTTRTRIETSSGGSGGGSGGGGHSSGGHGGGGSHR